MYGTSVVLTMSKPNLVIILSSKSAGSSALQRYLTENYDFRTANQFAHQESETLFWSKAASVLGLPQDSMIRSVVPYSAEEARQALQNIAKVYDLSAHHSDLVRKVDFFELFYRMVEYEGPRFVEKSPHHLYNTSNLHLLKKCLDYLSDRVDILIIGLVRDPMATVYSAWSRWRYNCKSFENEWVQSYENPLQFQSQVQNMLLVRYEDVVADATRLDDRIAKFLGVNDKTGLFSFHTRSIEKWKNDPSFGHDLSEGARHLAKQLGYDEGTLRNPHAPLLWSVSELYYRLRYLHVDLRRRLKGR